MSHPLQTRAGAFASGALLCVACGVGSDGKPLLPPGTGGAEGLPSHNGPGSAMGGTAGAANRGSSTGTAAAGGAPGGMAASNNGGGSAAHAGAGGSTAGGSTAGGSTGGADGVSGGASASGNGPGGSGSGGSRNAGPCADVFGATVFYPTAPGGLEWTSEFWAKAAHDLPFGSADPADPLGLANGRGEGTVRANGDGTLSLTGSQPRIYLGTTAKHPWLNVEVTVYYQRLQDDATPWAGLVVGARGGPDGHGSDNCTATTYYARFRHDGKADVEKELEHPASDTRESHAIWPANGPLPFNQWIGMKYVVYNDDAGGVRLQVFRDLTFGLNGGDWKPIIDYTDKGGWAPASNCAYEPDHVILKGGGVVFIRDTGTSGAGARYRNFTVREIDASSQCKE